MPEIVTILRRPEGLFRLVREPGASLAFREIAGSGEPGLDGCWEAMATIEPGRASDVSALRRVFAQTMPAASGWRSMPMPRAIRASGPPRATAAHPRAFAGTIHKPPKPSVHQVDLRPLSERWETVRRVVGLDEPHPFSQRLLPHTRLDVDGLESRVREALGTLRPVSAKEVVRIDQLVRRLGADLPERFLFIRGATPAALAAWMEASLVLAVEPRRALLESLCSGSLPDASTTLLDALARISALDGGFERRARILIDRLRSGASPSYVAGGLELETEYPAPWTTTWRLDQIGQRDVAPLVRRALGRLGLDSRAMNASLGPCLTHLPQALFDTLGAVPSAQVFVEGLLGVPDMSSAELREWLEFPIVLRHEAPGVWDAARPSMDRALRMRDELATPLRAPFAARLLEGVLVLESESHERVAALLDPARKTASRSNEAMGVFADLLVSGRALPMHDGVLAALDAVTRRRSNRPLVVNGMEALLAKARAACDRMLERSPKMLLRLARDIGAMHPSRASIAIERALEDDLWSPPSSIDELRRARPAVRRLRPELLPRSLSRFLDGEVSLTSAQRRQRLDRVRGEWDRLRTSLIRHHCDVELQRGVTHAPRRLADGERHALHTLVRAGMHRRALKRVLRSVLNRRAAGIFQHPESRAWLSKHPRIDARTLEQGIELDVDIDGLGRVRLAVERDLFEVLKMGDYVRTCLALGAHFESDAAGIALDANKRVVYARTVEGRVLARQLLAITEADQLVCRPVYRLQEHPGLDEAFVRYDHAFARQLGIEVASSDDYVVASILSRDLWDDARWELLAE